MFGLWKREVSPIFGFYYIQINNFYYFSCEGPLLPPSHLFHSASIYLLHNVKQIISEFKSQLLFFFRALLKTALNSTRAFPEEILFSLPWVQAKWSRDGTKDWLGKDKNIFKNGQTEIKLNAYWNKLLIGLIG